MKKFVLVIGVALAVEGFLISDVQAGLRSTLRDIFGKSLKPEEAIQRLGVILQAEDEMVKLGKAFEDSKIKIKEIDAQRQRLFDQNKGQLVKLQQAMTSKTTAIKEMAAEELRRLQVEKEKNKTNLKAVEDGLAMWNGIKAASSLMANAESNFGIIMNYANNLSGNSQAEAQSKYEELTLQKKKIESNMLDLQAIIASPNNNIFTASDKINTAFRELSSIQKDFQEAVTIMEKILTVPEQFLKDYTSFNNPALKKSQESLEVLVAAAKCPEVTAWTQAITIDASGRYQPSEKWVSCKGEYMQVAKESKVKSCKELSVISKKEQILACIDAAS